MNISKITETASLRSTDIHSPLPKRARAVYADLIAVQSQRFILGEGIDDAYQMPGRYFNTLEHLLKSFGKDAFAEASRDLFDRDLQALDFENGHFTGLHNMHSDIDPNELVHCLDFAATTIRGFYPLKNTSRLGDVVNTRTLFGDGDFWVFVYIQSDGIRNNKALLDGLLDHLNSWPRSLTINPIFWEHTMSVTAYPKGLMFTYFPGAVDYIKHVISPPGFELEKLPVISSIKRGKWGKSGFVVSDKQENGAIQFAPYRKIDINGPWALGTAVLWSQLGDLYSDCC
jgi:hypothetical protein